MMNRGTKLGPRVTIMGMGALALGLLGACLLPHCPAYGHETAEVQAEGGRTFYVDQEHPQASDANPGTGERPWKSARHGAMQLQPGDTLIIKEGYYYHHTGKRSEAGIRTARGGTAGKPIVIKAYPGDNVVVGSVPTPETPASKSTNPAIGPGGDHVIIEGFRIYGCAAFWGVKDGVLRNCEIWSGNDSEFNDCIRLEFAERCLIQNNIVHDNDQRVSMPGAGGSRGNAPLLMEYDSKDCVIEHNEFYNAVGAAVCLKDNPRNIAVRHNLFWGRGGGVMGSIQDTGQNVTVHGNVFCGLTDYGVLAHCALDGLTVSNNTFFNNGADIKTWTAETRNIEVFNNIFAHIVAGQLCVFVEPHSGDPSRDGAMPNITLFDHNCHHGAAAWKVGGRTVAMSLDEWRRHGSYGFDKHSLLADPKFADATKGDFRLMKDSPCLKAGRNSVTIGAYMTGSESIGVDPKTNLWANNRVKVDYSR